MIIGVPLMAVIYTLIQSALDITLKNKELSKDTNDYIYLDHIDNENKEFIERELPSILMAKKKAEKKKLAEDKKKEKELKRQEKLQNKEKASENDKNVVDKENIAENGEKTNTDEEKS